MRLQNSSSFPVNGPHVHSGNTNDGSFIIDILLFLTVSSPSYKKVHATPYQLALRIKKRLDDGMGTEHSACDCEATLQYLYYNIHFSLIYALFAESFIDTLKEYVFYMIYTLKLPLRLL